MASAAAGDAADTPRVRVISMRGSKRRQKCVASWAKALETTVFDAVVGKDVATEDERLGLDLYRRLRAGKRQRLMNVFDWSAIYVMTSKPQVGCALSHIALWRECVDADRAVVVVEDDVVLKGTRDDILRMVRGKALVSLVRLSKHKESETRLADSLFTFWGTQAYFLTPGAASTLLKHAFPLAMHIDKYIAAVASRSASPGWEVAVPQLRHSIEGSSSLEHDTLLKTVACASILACVVAVVLFLLFLLHRCRSTCRRSACSAPAPAARSGRSPSF